jgi:heme-degrading monooxygenase HmoA
MILEIARFAIKPGLESEFEAGVAKAQPLFARSKGCKSMILRRSIETPSRYWLFIEWETLENHTVDFRSSQEFPAWRQLVSHCFDSPPEVEHAELAAKGF